MELSKLRFGVIGGSAGLGSWVVRFLKEANLEVFFSSNDSESQFATNIQLVQNVEVVILAVPISAMKETMTDIFPHLHGKRLVEICSVKKFLIEHYQNLRQAQAEISFEFYSIHPMFSQSLKSLRGQVLLFNYADKANTRFITKFRRLFLKHSAQLYDLDYLEHDRIMGVVQGLNHFNVFVSAKTLFTLKFDFDKIKNFSSPPYRIFLVFFTRYVLQNPRLYADIQIYNEFVAEVVQVFRNEVNRLFDLIQTKNTEGFVEYVQEMQGYFESERADVEVSNHLIQQLGAVLSKK